jgi:hypothetical protein
MKCLLPVIFLATISSCYSNNHSKTTKKESPGYNLPIPKGWQTERIIFPIDFAPQISYTDVENVGFAPGWEFTTSEEHWSYLFLWWLDGNPKIDENVLQENLKIYYDGLVGRNITKRFIPPSKVFPTVAVIKRIETAQGDIETYRGTITITDYLDIMFNPVTLNCAIHKKDCSTHTTFLFEISPKPFEHKIWQALNKIQQDFTCGN